MPAATTTTKSAKTSKKPTLDISGLRMSSSSCALACAATMPPAVQVKASRLRRDRFIADFVGSVGSMKSLYESLQSSRVGGARAAL